ncbi:MAG: DUF2203 domain-containing protein [Ignavibacteriaceae bacterium]|nr:DUF2203 domain-containing protein [Ignavibacteriaceae bacterium]
MTTAVKYFTPAEAIKTLPLVRRIVADILVEGKEIKLLAEELAEEEINQDPRLLARLEQIDAYLKELEEIGCFYKDWNFTFGLVDFPAMFGGEEVYLCWRSDEESIRYYHSVQNGYSERKMIPEEYFYNQN